MYSWSNSPSLMSGKFAIICIDCVDDLISGLNGSKSGVVVSGLVSFSRNLVG